MLGDMFKKTYTTYRHANIRRPTGQTRSRTSRKACGAKCNKCGQPIYAEDVKNNYYICPKCKGYFRVHAYRRIEMLADEGTFEEWDKEMPFSNPLDFPGYEKKIQAAREKTPIKRGHCHRKMHH